MSEKMQSSKLRTDATQTDTNSIDRHFNKTQSMTTLNSQANLMDADGNNRESMRSTTTNGQRENVVQQNATNPFVNQSNFDQRQQTGNIQDSNYNQDYSKQQNDQGFHSQPQSMHFSEDVVETQTFPSPQMPVFSKVKQPPTILNHFETEPYRKILSRTNQPSTLQSTHSRYQDQAQQNQDPSFYDDFNKYRTQTYYQGPKVDQGKLLVIRDYSQQPQKHTCSCQNHNCEENEGQDEGNAAMKSGYVSQVAKLWDSRMQSNQTSVKSHVNEIRGLNTNV